ncbi:MAG: ribose 5-phosphate isomerase B [Clostridia bacterium]|nr:ribose 5-phosphate isomerase B [Clostridia bacterium]
MIGIGCDHGGYELKEHIKKLLESKGIEVKDFGTHNTDSIDYPDIAIPLCKSVVDGEIEFGILTCGTGIGMSICANKINGIRAAHVTDSFSARMTKMHNNSNVICLGGRITGPEIATDIVEAYMNAEFMGGRHQNRVDKVMELENI